jgi:hypothetical protein
VTKSTEFTVIKIDRDLSGNVINERTYSGPSIEDALAASQIKRMPWDGHLVKEALRTVPGADLKMFCNIEMSIVIGTEGSPDRDEYMRKAAMPVTCWKCADRDAT